MNTGSMSRVQRTGAADSTQDDRFTMTVDGRFLPSAQSEFNTGWTVLIATTDRVDWEQLRTAAINAVNADTLPRSIELPALPQAVSEFVARASNPDFDIRVLAAIVEKDAALTLELLKHVNSALFALRKPVGSVRDAIMQIGINSAKTHLLAAGVRAATRSIRSKLVNQRNFWNESLQRALFARELAHKLKLDPGLAFLGGLLQDYLLPVLTNHFDKEYIQYLNIDALDGRDLVDWERETFGWDHASVGVYFAAKWNFPDDLLCAINCHHSLPALLEHRDSELFKLFPVAMAALLPDQLRQCRNGVRELIRIDQNSPAIKLDEVCQLVDEDQSKLAEGGEGTSGLCAMLAATRRAMQQE